MAGSASKLSDILSQMISTRRSNVCLTLMLSLALVSKNSNPEAKKEKHSLSFHTSTEIKWDLVVVLSGDSGKGYGLCER